MRLFKDSKHFIHLPLEFKTRFKQIYYGKTFIEIIKSIFNGRFIDEKTVGGTCTRFKRIRSINIYLPSITKRLKECDLCFDDIDKKFRYKELTQGSKELIIIIIIGEIVLEEYLHMIFIDTGIGMTRNQEHYIIPKMIKCY